MALKNPDPGVRFAAVRTLDERKSRPAIEQVALRDPEVELRELAIAKLERGESREVLKTIALTDASEFLMIDAAEKLDPVEDRVVFEKLKSMGIRYLSRRIGSSSAPSPPEARGSRGKSLGCYERQKARLRDSLGLYIWLNRIKV